MNSVIWVSLLAAVAATGCASVFKYDTYDLRAPVRSVVSFDGRRLSVDRPLIVISPKQTEAVLEWELLAESGTTFPENGIFPEGEVVFPSETKDDKPDELAVVKSLLVSAERKSGFVCTREKEGLKFTCKSSALVPGVYKYTVRVRAKNGQIFKVDPSWVISPR